MSVHVNVERDASHSTTVADGCNFVERRVEDAGTALPILCHSHCRAISSRHRRQIYIKRVLVWE